jgi:hypothetical protein
MLGEKRALALPGVLPLFAIEEPPPETQVIMGEVLIKALWVVGGAIVGLIVSTVANFPFCMAIGLTAMLLNPGDSSAGSCAEIGIFFLPLFWLVGIVAGGYMGWKKARRYGHASSAAG